MKFACLIELQDVAVQTVLQQAEAISAVWI